MSFYDISVGSGFQVVTIDLTGSDADLLASLSSAKVRIYNDESGEIEASYEAQSPILPAAPAIADGEASLYSVTKQGVLAPYTATILRVCHTFKDRGLYLISVSLTDNPGNETYAPTAIRVGVGNGFPREVA